jgi:hypothetical protein
MTRPFVRWKSKSFTMNSPLRKKRSGVLLTARLTFWIISLETARICAVDRRRGGHEERRTEPCEDRRRRGGLLGAPAAYLVVQIRASHMGRRWVRTKYIMSVRTCCGRRRSRRSDWDRTRTGLQRTRTRTRWTAGHGHGQGLSFTNTDRCCSELNAET